MTPVEVEEEQTEPTVVDFASMREIADEFEAQAKGHES